MNLFLDKQYKISFNIEDLHKKYTVLDNLKSKTLSSLSKSLEQKNLQKSINLAIELVFSGYYEIVLTKIVDFYIKYINMAQPRGILYISSFYKYYNNKYYKKAKKTKKIELINDQVLRNFINNFITLICGSNQRKILNLLKINSSDFNLNNKKDFLVSKNLDMVSKYITSTDNKIIIIPLSEIITLLRQAKHKEREQKIVYWISWLLEYEKIYHKGKLELNYRDVEGIDNKYTGDYLWIIWQMLNDSVKDLDFKKYINNLENIYKQNYTGTARKKKVSLLIFAILIFINPIPRLLSPIPAIDKLLFRNMQYEVATSNIRYYSLKKKLIINNL